MILKRMLDIGHKIGGGRFEIKRLVARGGFASVFEAIDLGRLPHCSVVVKCLSGDADGASQETLLEEYFRECSLLANQAHAGLVRVLGYGTEEGIPWVAQEYVAGVSLRDRMDAWSKTAAASAMPLPLVLDTGIKLASALTAFHALGIIHGCIAPDNIRYRQGDSEQPVLMNFGQSRFFHFRARDPNHNVFGSLAYMSPENFGFLAGGLRPASDLYALGVSLYEMASGKAIFSGASYQETCEKILTLVPERLDELRDDFSGPLADIIDKLMRKQPESRYATAHGLAADLRRLSGDLVAGTRRFFALGTKDPARELNYRSAMIGREKEMATLQSIAEKTLQNEGKFMLVGAPSGVGKTRLVMEFFSHCEQRGFALFRAKFTEFDQNIPLSAIEKSMAYVVKRLAAMGSGELSAWQNYLEQKLQGRGRLILKKFPYLSPYLPNFNHFSRVDQETEETLFLETMVDFFAVMFGLDTPLFMFLDDLQWADDLSLKLVTTFAARARNNMLGQCSFIGAFRSNEEAAITDQVVPLITSDQYLSLDVLDRAAADRLVESLLDEAGPAVARLQELTFNITQGNAFFIYEFLNAALRDKLFAADDRGFWVFDASRIQKGGVGESVSELVSTRIDKLSADAHYVLGTASVVGNNIPIALLCELLDRMQKTDENASDSPLHLQRVLHELQSHHLIWDYDHSLVFFHDHIRISSLARVPGERINLIHDLYADILEAAYFDGNAEVDSKILFEAAHHVQQGFPERHPERSRKILRMAGERALSLFAYTRAKGYLKSCLIFYPRQIANIIDAGLLQEYCLTHELLGDALALTEEINQAIVNYNFCLEHWTDPQKRAAIYLKLSQNHQYLFQYPESIKAGTAGLRELGERYRVSELASLVMIVFGLPVMLIYLAWFRLFGRQTRTIQSVREELLWNLRIGLQVPAYFTKPLTAIASHIPYTIRLLRYKDNRYRTMAVVYWGLACAVLGFTRISRYCYNKGLIYFKDHYDPVLYSFCIFTMGYILEFSLGRLKEAGIKIHEALRITDNIGETFVRFLSYQGLIHIENFGGNTHEADATILKLEQLWRRVNFHPTVMGCRVRTLVAKNQLADAQTWINRVLATSTALNAQGFETIDTTYALLASAEAYLMMGQPERAIPLLRKGVKAALVHFHRVSYINYGAIMLSQAYTRVGRPFTALFALTPVLLNMLFTVIIFTPQTFYAFGEALMKIGFSRFGRKAIERGILTAKRRGFVLIVEEGRYLLGNLLVQTDPEYAENLLTMARKYFSTYDFPYFVAGCNKTLELCRNISRKMFPELACEEEKNASSIVKLREHLEASSLLGMFTKLSVLTDMDILLETALDTACSISGADHGVVLLKKGDSWVPKKGKRIDIRGDSLKYVAEKVDVTFLEKALAMPMTEPLVRSAMPTARTVGLSVMVLPLHYQAETCGVIYLGSNNVRGLFDERSVGILGQLGTQVAVAIQNFFLLDRTQNLVSRLKNNEQVIKELNEELQKHIDRLDIQVEEKTRHIASILQNVEQGIFTIDAAGKIGEDYSPFMHNIIKETKLAGEDAVQSIFGESSLGLEMIQRLREALNMCLGNSVATFEINRHHFVKEFRRREGAGHLSEMVIEVDWSPIVNDLAQIEEFLVVLRNVSQKRQFQDLAVKQQEELMAIGELLHAGRQDFTQFLRLAQNLLNENQNIILAQSDFADTHLRTLLFNLHSLKGACRSLGFKNMSMAVHQAEEQYKNMWENKVPRSKNALKDEQVKLQGLLDGLLAMGAAKLGWGLPGNLDTPDITVMKLDEIHGLARALEKIDLAGVGPDEGKILTEVRERLSSACYRDAKHVLTEILSAVGELAVEFGKPAPRIRLSGNSFSFTPDAVDMLSSILVHLVNNSIGHGIESVRQRLDHEKSPEGCIAVELEEIGEQLRIQYRDDGHGLDLARIRAVGIEKGLIDAGATADRKIADLIFVDGLTTAESVTMTSGRGLGMSAVKSFLESNGCTIETVLDPSQADELGAPFAFHIWLPRNFYKKTA